MISTLRSLNIDKHSCQITGDYPIIKKKKINMKRSKKELGAKLSNIIQALWTNWESSTAIMVL